VEGPLAVVHAASRPQGRHGAAVHERRGVWRVTLADGSGAPVPRDLAGFREFARALERPELADLVDGWEPLDDGAGWRPERLVRRGYEHTVLPRGLVVLGDAVATLEPGGGLGMTVAAQQAVALRAFLDARGGLDPATFERYPAQCAALLDPAWAGATGLLGAARRLGASADPAAVARALRVGQRAGAVSLASPPVPSTPFTT
jgi:2-polyprenyl-6-methoxyphenol hydroxylase-like FAD-dependent oxidoreductase